MTNQPASTTTKHLDYPTLTDEIRKNRKEISKLFNKDFAMALMSELLDKLDEDYFRTEFIGFDGTPERNNPERPLIYVGNHSGMAFPWDGMIFAARFNKRYEYGENAIRPLIAPLLTASTLMNPYQVVDIWKRCGAVDATTLNFETMMHMTEQNILIYPEGVPGIGKGFNNKYKLQRFATSFVRMSIKYKTDIIPVHTINAEYINPGSFKVDWIDKLVQKIGIPFLPLSWIVPCIVLQPWIFYFAFPAQMNYVRGKRIKPYEMTDKPFEELERADFIRIANQIRAQMQEELNENVEKYGQQPFKWKQLWKQWRKNWKRFPFMSPAFWAVAFHEFQRRWKKHGKVENFNPRLTTLIPMMLKNPFTISLYIPVLGLIPFILRGYLVGKSDKKK